MWHLIGLILIVGFLTFLMSDKQRKAQDRVETQQYQSTDQARALYLEAKKAINFNDWERFNELSPQLVNYPLFQELYYEALMKQLPALPQKQINFFFDRYPQGHRTKQLRSAWLSELAKQKRWDLYTNYYKKSQAKLNERCQIIMAKYYIGDNRLLQHFNAKLWLIGRSAPKSCDPVFDYWLQHKLIGQEQIWQRFRLALNKNNYRLSGYLAGLLASPDKQSAELWIKIKQKPALIKQQLKSMKALPYQTEILTDGLTLWSKTQPKETAKLWPKFNSQFKFSELQKTDILQSISHSYIKQHSRSALSWLKKVDYQYYDETMAFWRIRPLLAKTQWPELKTVIEQLDEELRQLPIWRYWYARALAQQKEEEKANALYQQLAQERHYYGVLAANQLDQIPSLKNKKYPISHTEKNIVQNIAGISKARELYAMNDYRAGNKIWWETIAKMNHRQRYVAAVLAKEWGWDLVSLKTTTKTKYKHDLDLRFPRLYYSQVNKLSEQHELEPALVYAIIRQESLFYPAAKSPAGAQGLMQLMPYTAKMVINKAELPASYANRLSEPQINIHLGCYYLSHLLEQYYEHPVLSIASYNAGPNRIKKWLPHATLPTDLWVELIPWHETRNYVKNVITYTAIYQKMMGVTPNLANYLQPGIKR